MKNDWLKDIHNRMADFEVDEPQGLWDDICSAETECKKLPVTGKRRSKTLWIMSGVAAACLLLFGIFHHGPIDSIEEKKSSITDNKTACTQPASVGSSSSPVIPDLLADVHKTLARTGNTEVPQSSAPRVAMASSRMTETAIKDSSYSSTPMQTIKQSEESKEPQETSVTEQSYATGSTLLASSTAENLGKIARTPKSRFAVSLATSGGIGTNERHAFYGENICASPALGDYEWMDSPLLGIMAMNRGTETERKVTHHSPIRTGLSFMYRLNNRWSLETGISYALVSSDIREGSNANYIQEEQKLHYIGIPAGVSYRLLSLKHLDVYLSSNVLAEQCVSGKSRRQYFITNKAQEEETNAITSRPTQWSVGAKAGVQYNLNNQFSVYLEPGCIYYFDDHSSLETVFKERSYDFNLNLGFRLSVGNKY